MNRIIMQNNANNLLFGERFFRAISVIITNSGLVQIVEHFNYFKTRETNSIILSSDKPN